MKDQAPRAALIGVVVLIAVSLTLSGWALASRFQEGNQSRMAITESIRTVLCYARASVEASDPAQRDAADRFYDHALALIHARPCNTVLKGN